MNELYKVFLKLPEEEGTLISGIIDNQELLCGKEILHTNKEAGEKLEVDYTIFESMRLVELASKKMLEINAKQKETEMATQVHYPADEVQIIVDYCGISFSMSMEPYWKMKTRVLFR